MRDCLVAHNCDALILHLEEEFAVSLANDELEPVATVQQLYQLTVNKAGHSPSRLVAFAFNQLRRQLAAALAIAPSSIRPSTPLTELFPGVARFRLWRQVADRSGLRFPALQHAQPNRQRVHLAALALAACLVGLAGVGFHLLAHSGFAAAAFLRWTLVQALLGVTAAVAWLVLFSLLSRWLLALARRLATEFPVATAGDLACTLLSLNWEHFESQAPSAAQSQAVVWDRMVVLLSAELEIPPERIHPETRLREDLGLD